MFASFALLTKAISDENAYQCSFLYPALLSKLFEFLIGFLVDTKHELLAVSTSRAYRGKFFVKFWCPCIGFIPPGGLFFITVKRWNGAMRLRWIFWTFVACLFTHGLYLPSKRCTG